MVLKGGEGWGSFSSSLFRGVARKGLADKDEENDDETSSRTQDFCGEKKTKHEKEKEKKKEGKKKKKKKKRKKDKGKASKGKLLSEY